MPGGGIDGIGRALNASASKNRLRYAKTQTDLRSTTVSLRLSLRTVHRTVRLRLSL